MIYPEHLADHESIASWHLADCFFNQNGFYYVKCYHHPFVKPFGMHRHSFYEINIIVRGQGRHYLGDKSCEAAPGTVFVIPPQVRHGYVPDGTLDVYHILLSDAFCERFSRELAAMRGYSLFFEIEPMLRGEFEQSLFLTLSAEELDRLLPLFDQLEQSETDEDNNVQIARNAAVLKLLSEWCKAAAERNHRHRIPTGDHYAGQIVRTMEVFRERCEQRMDLEAVAKEAGLSYTTFLRSFRAVCGKTPSRYLAECRVARAKRLLTDEDAGIAAIAQECGFFDSSHLIRTFKAVTGQTPTAYRAEKAGEDERRERE